MQAVILAAGFGTRMGELTKGTPKPMLRVKDQTILEHNLTAMPEEIDEVILIVGYLKDQIKSHIGNEFLGRKITYVEQKELKGTAHAVTEARELIQDRFLVMMGDDLYLQEDLKNLVRHPLGILVWELESDESARDRQALVQTDGKGKLVDIVERQPAVKGALVNTGAYVLNRKFFDYPLVSAGTPPDEFGLPQTFMQMVRDGAKFDVVKARWWHKIASPGDLWL